MPHTIIAIYEVEGAWNRCVNHFIEEQNHVKWVLESEFIFKEEMNIPKEAFEKKTLKGMEIFKEYVEKKKILP